MLDADTAHKLAVKLESHIIIPMHYEGIGAKDALKNFNKEDTSEKPAEKLTLKKKDLIGRNGDIIVLTV